MKILLLDDVELPLQEAQKALEEILQESQPEFLSFSDPLEALRHYRQIRGNKDKVDLLLTDILMPGMNGFEFVREVLHYEQSLPLEERNYLPIILHTGSWSKDWLSKFVLNGGSRSLPIDIASKSYIFPSPEEYQQALKEVLFSLQERVQRLAQEKSSLNPALLDKMIQEMKGRKDGLIDYLKAVYQELSRDFQSEVSRLPFSELRDKLGKVEIDFQWERTDHFLHKLHYPLDTIGMMIDYFEKRKGVTASPEVQTVYLKMCHINDLLVEHFQQFNVSPEDYREYAQRLASLPKTPFPENSSSIKLERRLKRLQHLGAEHLLVAPNSSPRDYESEISNLLSKHETLILRSMHSAEDRNLPLAGYFDSLTFSTLEELAQAKERIEAMTNPDLELFCQHHHLEKPSAGSMFLLVEPYHNTRYLGSMIEHPNEERLYLIEFSEREIPTLNTLTPVKKLKYSFLFDAKTYQFRNVTLPEEINNGHPLLLAHQLVELFMRNKQLFSSSASEQMEFGFDLEEDRFKVSDYQIRTFKEIVPFQEFSVPHPYSCLTQFGCTSSQGLDLVLVDPFSPEQLIITAQKAAQAGMKIAYLADSSQANFNPNWVNLVDNLGLVITGDGLAVMAHHYFNPLSQTENALILSPQQMKEFKEEFGSARVVHYLSNGREASLSAVDDSEAVKYQIRDVLSGKRE